MRRVFLFAAALSCVIVVTARAGGLIAGVHAGSSIPDLRDNGGGDLSSGYSSRVAPFFGAFAEKSYTPAFSLRAEVNYAAQGGKREGMQPLQDASQFGAPPGTTLYANFKTVAKLDYLEIPVLARYHFGGLPGLFVNGGPYAGFLLSTKTETSGSSEVYLDPQGQMPANPGTSYSFDATTDNKSDLNTFNWGVQAGAGYTHPVGTGTASLEVRGGLGLMNIQKDSANGKNSTGVLVIAAGYGWAVGK
ncbi:MAG: porin family protein [Candidatus Eisenbacteria bacterium]